MMSKTAMTVAVLPQLVIFCNVSMNNFISVPAKKIT